MLKTKSFPLPAKASKVYLGIELIFYIKIISKLDLSYAK